MIHSNASIAQQKIRFKMLFWFAAKHFPFLMFKNHMSQKRRKHLFSFMFVSSKVQTCSAPRKISFLELNFELDP